MTGYLMMLGNYCEKLLAVKIGLQLFLKAHIKIYTEISMNEIIFATK